jgi:hypothetical protein
LQTLTLDPKSTSFSTIMNSKNIVNLEKIIKVLYGVTVFGKNRQETYFSDHWFKKIYVK